MFVIRERLYAHPVLTAIRHSKYVMYFLPCPWTRKLYRIRSLYREISWQLACSPGHRSWNILQTYCALPCFGFGKFGYYVRPASWHV